VTDAAAEGAAPEGAPTARALIERLFRAMEARDLPGALAAFAEDAEVTDPHYPTPRMRGRAEIADGLRWAFGGVAQFGFTVTAAYERGGGAAAVEVATAHALRAGPRVEVAQMFAVEARDGRITALRAYAPYGPPGLGGVALALARLARRARGR
jgi:ketosteroid isomerase-like protein